MKFKEVIGHESLKTMLRRNADSGRISHAQLFAGESGWDVLPLAMAYAQYVNCSARHDGDSCGECPSCRQMEQLAHPDMHFVFPTVAPKKWSGSQKPTSDYFLPQWRQIATRTSWRFDEQMWYAELGVDNAQGAIAKNEADEIIRKLSFKSFDGGYKIVLVWLPEKMNESAANTLLKILEEPWEKTLFLLVSERPERLLKTILSRTQSIEVPRIDEDSLAAYAVRTQGVAPDRSTAAAHSADGSVLSLQKILAEGDGKTDENFQAFASLMRLSYGNRHLELLDWAERMAGEGREGQKDFLEYSLGLLRESYMLTAGMERISYLWGAEKEFCSKFAPYVNNTNIEALVSETERTLKDIMQNGNAKIVLTHYALSVSKLIVQKG